MGVMLPLSGTVCLNNLGRKAAGALLNIYRDGTDTPAVGYTDPDLATPHQDPIAADGNGRWPAIYLDYGAYRLKIRTAAGSVLFDADGANFPAPTDQEVTVDEDALLKTGEVFFKFRDGTRTGAVRANGRTIGSAVSGASERANADTEPLFAELYNALSDAVCPVSGGRGANAAADFAANKTLTLPDLRGRAPFGLDTMGVLPAGRFNAVVPFPVGSATTPGSVAGANHVTLDSTMIPTHTHALTSVTVSTGGSHTHGLTGGSAASNGAHAHSGSDTTSNGAHAHTVSGYSVGAVTATGGQNALEVTGSGGAGAVTAGTTTDGTHTHGLNIVSDGAHTHSLSGTTDSGGAHNHTLSGSPDSYGSGGAHNNLPGVVLGTWYIKL